MAEQTYSVELERARNFFPFSFLRLPLRFPVEKRSVKAPFTYKHTHVHRCARLLGYSAIYEVDLLDTLPGIAPRSAIFTDVRDVFGVWDPLAP